MLKKLGKTKEIIIISCILVLLLSGIATFFFLQGREKNEEVVLTSKYDISWFDEAKDEYLISSKDALLGFADLSKTIDFAGKTIKLANDIVINEGNAKEWAKQAPETVWVPITNFAGTFDGQGKSISGLYANITSGGAGLFVETQENSVIRDFSLTNSYIYSQTSKGSGSISSGGSGKIERIYTDAIIVCNGFYCGGIIGNMKDGTSINECWFDGSITINGSCAGGIASSASKGKSTVAHCLNTGTVTSTYKGPDPAVLGGICGVITKKLTVEDCLNAGTVISEAGLEQVGGLFGLVSGGTINIDSVWTTKESAVKAVGFAKSGLDGIYGERLTEHLKGVGGYQKTDLDFETYWAIVENNVPTLQYFADEVPEIPKLERAIVADISWYNMQKNEFILHTAEELLGLARFTEQGYGNRFSKKTVKLGKDIVFNEGNAEDFAKNAPLNEWTPIYNFTGTFDGQGHTISGLSGYTLEGSTKGMALFSGTRESTVVKNVKVTNSYFTTATAHGLSAISSRGGGKFQNIYADAILISPEQGSIGGILGMVTLADAEIENCWSNCTITSGNRRIGGIVGNGNGRENLSIKHCLNTGTLTRSFDGVPTDSNLRKVSSLFGGIIGGTGTGSKGKYKGSFLIEDCLNVGLIRSEKENDGLGGIAGTTTGHTEDGKVTVTVRNSYCTESSCERIIGSKNSQTDAYDVIRLTDAMLTGEDAYFYTSLNFKEYWTALSEKTPVLTAFASGAGKQISVTGERSDISWYTPRKKEYTIKNKEQLYGFARLAFGGEKFEGQTIKLSEDIVVNTGDAQKWASGSAKAERVWTSIKNFAGTFDGQGHSISGLYAVVTGVHEDREGLGLFVETKDTAVLQNFSIKNSYLESTYANGLGAVAGRGGGTFRNIYVAKDVYLQNKLCGSVGAILGMTTKTTTVENCWSAATIQVAGQGVGGIIGNGNAQNVKIKNCLNTGEIKRSFKGLAETLASYDYEKYPSYYADTSSKAAFFGGIIGRTGGGSKGAYTGNFVIENCVNTGILTSERDSDALGGIIAQTTGLTADGVPTVTIKNAYATKSSCAKIIASKNAEAVIEECLLLDDAKLIGEESYFYTALDFKKHWGAPRKGTPILKTFAKQSDNVISYYGEWSDISWYKASEVNQKISDKADLYGMVRLSLAGETFAGKNIVVETTEPIIINEGDADKWANGTEALPKRVWIPIQGFAGVFDGNGCIISGIYSTQDPSTGVQGIGLFAETNKATIRNFHLVNSYYAVNTSTGTGAVTGQGSGEFADIHADVIMKDTNKKGFIGGIIGKATDTVSVQNCWSECDITTNQRNIGGIVGDGNAKAVTIKHCLNSGNLTISSGSTQTTCYTGGIIGKTGAGSASKGWSGSFLIEDCLNTGIVKTESATATGTIGTVVGYATGANEEVETVNIVNSYGAVVYDSSNVCQSVQKAIGSDYRANKSGCAALNGEKLIDVDGFYNTDLSFATSLNPNGYWSVRKNATPMLVDYLTSNDETVDVSGMSKTSFTLIDNKGDIVNLQHLESFRDKMNDGSLIVNKDTVITLKADIDVNSGTDTSAWASHAWTPIKGFPGTFNGNGHAIRGLYVQPVSGIKGVGLFTETQATTIIENLRVENSLFIAGDNNGTGAVVGQGKGVLRNIYTEVQLQNTSGDRQNMGGIVGSLTGEMLIENCWSNSDITTRYINVGGIVGNANANKVVIRHCLNTGDITITSICTASNAYAGGIIGKSGGGSASKGWTGNTLIEDCFSEGIIKSDSSKTTKSIGGIAGYGTGNNANGNATLTIINSCFADRKDSTITGTIASDVVGAYQKNATLVNSKKVAYDKLQGTNAFYYTDLDFQDATYKEGHWVAREGKTPMLASFATGDKTVKDLSVLSGDTFALTNNRAYITSLNQLLDFRNKMNNDLEVDANTVIRLTRDIVVNTGTASINVASWTTWTPIVGYPGTFDGKGHIISGLYVQPVSGISGVGLFTGTTATTTIQNLRVENSLFTAGDSNGTGAVVGRGRGILRNIYTDVQLQNTSGNHQNIGGLIGILTGETLIENCWSNSDITTRYINVGGIVGNANANKAVIRHCLNTGDITITSVCTATNAYAGGIIGKSGGGSASKGWTGNTLIEDCFSEGIIKSDSSKTKQSIGGIVGYGTGKDADKKATLNIKNSYSTIRVQENISGTVASALVGANASLPTITQSSFVANYNNLKGNLAFTNAPQLDYVGATNIDGYWVARQGATPMLLSFLRSSDVAIQR